MPHSGTANVEFDNNLAYRTAPAGIGLLGRTSSNELASIPFFAEPRVATSSSMTIQTDPTNLLNTMGPSSGINEALSFFGVYLDINQPVNRFPNTYTGDGGFGGTLYSIRNLLMGNHQCMMVEVFYTPDPTVNGATPGTSDNLSQRNLLIVQTANPGDEITRTVQHLFNIDLKRKRVHLHKDDHHDHNTNTGNGHTHANGGNGHHKETAALEHSGEKHSHTGTGGQRGHTETAVMTHAGAAFVKHLEHNKKHKHLNPDANCCDPIEVLPVIQKFHTAHDHGAMDHIKDSWVGQFPKLLAEEMRKIHALEAQRNRWRFDEVDWKAGTGLDELVFFWNNLPKDSVVEIYLPNVPASDVLNYRNLRHAPGTVKVVNDNTLRLLVGGVTYLPVPPFYGDNIAGLITVQLPAGIKKGERYKVDVFQMRTDEARTLGGFQLNIQVEKAFEIFDAERKWLELFHQRLTLMPKTDRWFPIMEKQVAFTRNRAKALVDLANKERPTEPPVTWSDPTEKQKGQPVKVILEKIQILDDREPFFKGKGEFRFYTKVLSSNNSGLVQKMVFPQKGHFQLGDKPGVNEVIINEVIFDNYVEDTLFIQIGGHELDTFDADDVLNTYKRVFNGSPAGWIGNYGAQDGEIDPEHVGGWKVWYKIEYAG